MLNKILNLPNLLITYQLVAVLFPYCKPSPLGLETTLIGDYENCPSEEWARNGGEEMKVFQMFLVAAACAVMFLMSSDVLAQDGGKTSPTSTTAVKPGTSPVNPTNPTPTTPASPAQQPANVTPSVATRPKKEGEPDPDDEKIGGDGGVPTTKAAAKAVVDGEVIEVGKPNGLVDTLRGANEAERRRSAELAEEVGELKKQINALKALVTAEQAKTEAAEIALGAEVAKFEGMVAASDADAQKWADKYIELVKSGGDAYQVDVLKATVNTLEVDKTALRVKIAAIEAEGLEKLGEAKAALGVVTATLASTQTELSEAKTTLEATVATLETKFQAAMSRGFWARLFNTEPEGEWS